MFVVIVLLLQSYVLGWIFVSGDSMHPTYNDGDVLLERKYGLLEYARYDVVIVSFGGERLIKRIMGLPLETIVIQDGYLLVDGERLYSDLDGKIQWGGCAEGCGVTLGVDEYFVLGDNYNHSGDSRKFGAVGSDNISGVAVFKVFPFSDFGFIENTHSR